jgi:superfamily II DNA helicase RecQ
MTVSSAQVWNSTVSDQIRKGVLAELVSDEPEMRLLYTTPESLRNPKLREYLQVSSGLRRTKSVLQQQAPSLQHHDMHVHKNRCLRPLSTPELEGALAGSL